MYKLKDKVALVTGASRGIGRAIAIKFAQEGAHVYINYASNEKEALNTLKIIKDEGNKAKIMGFDISNSSQANKAIEDILNDFGRIDILVNNAGISVDGLIIRLKEEDFDRQINTNLKGAFILTKACVRPMLKQHEGRIINISSVVGQMGNAGQSIYAAAKAGLIGMTKSLARELALRNILVNAIAPGFIVTDMTKGILEKNEKDILPAIPLGRVGTPKDIANAALFLACEDSSYITGQVLSVNGGMYI